MYEACAGSNTYNVPWVYVLVWYNIIVSSIALTLLLLGSIVSNYVHSDTDFVRFIL